MNNTAKSEEHQPGLICPACNFKIKFTIQELLQKKSIVCPSCNLTLEMDAPTDMKKHLEEIRLAEEMVKKSDKFAQ